MAFPAVTYTFANSTTADGPQVSQNFTDVINGLTDGTKSLSISALTAAGSLTTSGNVILGLSASNSLTFNCSLASTIPILTTNTYNIGSDPFGLLGVYFGSSGSAHSTVIVGSAVTLAQTLTLPNTAGVADTFAMLTLPQTMVTKQINGIGLNVVTKTSNYTATVADSVIICNANAGSFTITLFAAAGNTGKTIEIKRSDSTYVGANTVVIAHAASETFDGYTTLVMYTQYESFTLVSDGTNWSILRHKSTTPWTVFTPTTNTGTQANTGRTVLGSWRRMGDSIQMRIDYQQTVNTGAAAGSGTYGWNIPTGTIDSAKCLQSGTQDLSVVGSACGGNGTLDYIGTVNATNISSSVVIIVLGSDIQIPTPVGAGFLPFTTAQMRVSCIATFPITGWIE